MKISSKLIFSFLLVASLSGVTTVFALRSYDSIDQAFTLLIDDPTATLATLNDLKQAGVQIVSSTGEFIFAKDEGGWDSNRAMAEEEEQLRVNGKEAFEHSLQRLSAIVGNRAGDDQTTLQNITDSGNNLIATSREIIELKKHNISGGEILDKRETFERDEMVYLQYVNKALQHETEEQLIGQHDVRSTITLSTSGTIVVTVLTFLLAIFAGFYISYLISKRMIKLQHAIYRVGIGELDTQIETAGKDEIGDLSRSFNRMIDNLKESRDEIVTAKQFTDSVIESIANVLFVLDMDLRIVRVNQAALSTLGFGETELIGHSAHILRPDGGFFNGKDFSRLETESFISGVETFLNRKDGTEVPVLFSASMIPDLSGRASGIVCVVQDITERKLLEDKAQRGQKLESIGQLAAGIAHEINTPTQYVGDNVHFLEGSFDDLRSVLDKTDAMIDLCRSQDLIPEFVKEIEATIESADVEYLYEEVPKAFRQALSGVGRISKIVQSMKDFAHPSGAAKQKADLNRAIESTITVASNEWKYVAELETDYDETLPSVLCNVGELNQVILNMIVNAAHSIGDRIGDGGSGKGRITVSTKRIQDSVEIRVGDTGSGMSALTIKKIFDPFFTTKEVGKGTGQGLAISHTIIVEKHKGTISVESEIGKGTTFIIRLPLADELGVESVECKGVELLAV